LNISGGEVDVAYNSFITCDGSVQGSEIILTFIKLLWSFLGGRFSLQLFSLLFVEPEIFSLGRVVCFTRQCVFYGACIMPSSLPRFALFGECPWRLSGLVGVGVWVEGIKHSALIGGVVGSTTAVAC
jgi:hypothetical protein